MPEPIKFTAPNLVCYARFEPSVKVRDYKPSIRANVHDALWMLTQQFRVGEFQGTDGGTLVKAKIETQSTKINRYKSRNGEVEAFDEEIPIEAKTERLPFKKDLAFSMQLGYRWFKLLKIHIPATDYRSNFINEFPLPEVIGTEEPEKASNTAAMQIRGLMQSRSMDGVAFYNFLLSGGNASDIVPGVPQMNTAQLEFVNWLKNTFYVPEAPDDVSWSPQQLEYQCSISAPLGAAATSAQSVLLADKYRRGNVDWYSFDLDADASNKLQEDTGSVHIDNGDAILDPEVYTYIPSTIDFKGMPKGRWWEFEDRNIDLSKMMTQKQDISKMVVTEFGLIYSNDWLIIPHVIKDNTLTAVNGLVVTDVFGRQFLVKRAGEGHSWQKWDMYNTSRKGEGEPTTYEKLLMIASLKNRMESEPVEKVSFLRDEMANMVWGVEDVVPDELFSGMDGKTTALLLQDYLAQEFPQPDPPSDNDAAFRFRISNAVPENWIPFIPKKLELINDYKRNIMVQRATMRRYINDNYTQDLVHPRTDILSYGLDQTPAEIYLINEEEMSRQGLIITANYQRTRWYNGAIFTWFGRMVKSGRGEGNSGLKFDFLADKEPDSTE